MSGSLLDRDVSAHLFGEVLGELVGRNGAVGHAEHDGFPLVRVERQHEAVDPKEGIRSEEGHALVAVDERVVLGEPVPIRGGELRQASVVAGLGPHDGALEKATVTDAIGAAGRHDGARVGSLDVIDAQKDDRRETHRYFARRRKSSAFVAIEASTAASTRFFRSSSVRTRGGFDAGVVSAGRSLVGIAGIDAMKVSLRPNPRLGQLPPKNPDKTGGLRSF